jgi:hypothetical protein
MRPDLLSYQCRAAGCFLRENPENELDRDLTIDGKPASCYFSMIMFFLGNRPVYGIAGFMPAFLFLCGMKKE